MSPFHSVRSITLRMYSQALASAVAVVSISALAGGIAHAQVFTPGNLVVSRTVYTGSHSVHVGDILPPNCTHTTGDCSAGTGAIAGTTYPEVFNNVLYDPAFGITTKIFLDQVTLQGNLINTLEVPNSTQPGVTSTSDQLVTSFSSKSELALHLSTNKKSISFMGYVAPVATVDASNSNTPHAVDPTNPVGEAYYRAVGTVDNTGTFSFVETNAYSGNNGRAAILDGPSNIFYTAGDAGNGANPQPNLIVLGAGAQFMSVVRGPEYLQNPTAPRPVASFSVTQLGDKADKVGKDDNFRGMAIFNNVLYYAKGSGSNGVNTVYFVDTTGTACPNGVGLPIPGATLPSKPLPLVPSATLATDGLPSNMCILKGFPTALAKKADPVAFPQGLWFADANTLYVADEGDGYTGGPDLYTHAATQPMAGLQKWVFNSTSQSWTLAYTLQTNLNLGKAYPVAAYPTGINEATGLPWEPATDGLRNITGVVGDGSNPKLPVGKVEIFAVSSTISGGGDIGADPNKVYYIVDDLANTDPAVAAKEGFHILLYAPSQQVFRGISFTPGTANITSF